MRKMLLSLWLVALVLQTAGLALPSPVGRDVVHRIGDNENLNQIARKYGLAPEHIEWANDLSPRRPPQPGDELVIPMRRIPPFTPRESTAIVLNLPERMLYLFRGGVLTKFWGVAIGGDNYPTPSGTFSIIAKEKNPTWEPPKWLEKKAIPPGPDNPLGDRWMQITSDMVGIHGTNNPDSIGGVASLGCVRLYPEAIHELYDQVGVGTRVYVVYEQARVGREADGTLVWSFFPDPYYKHFGTFQAQEALKEARQQGQDIAISDFEIEERMREAKGVIAPVFGHPVTVTVAGREVPGAAYLKPTGSWLDASILESQGFEVRTDNKARVVRISSRSNGRVALLKAEKVPLNPVRVPAAQGDAPFSLDGHKWKGRMWVPFPLILDYFEVPYRWDSKTSLLEIDPPTVVPDE